MKQLLGLVAVGAVLLGLWFFAGGGAHQMCLSAIESGKDDAISKLACKVTAGDIAAQFNGHQ